MGRATGAAAYVAAVRTLQLAAPALAPFGGDAQLFRLAGQLERASPWF